MVVCFVLLKLGMQRLPRVIFLSGPCDSLLIFFFFSISFCTNLSFLAFRLVLCFKKIKLTHSFACRCQCKSVSQSCEVVWENVLKRTLSWPNFFFFFSSVLCFVVSEWWWQFLGMCEVLPMKDHLCAPWSLVAVKGVQQWSWPVCFCAYNLFHFQADFFNWFDQTKERLSWKKLYVMLLLAAALLLRLDPCRYLHKSVLRILDASWIKGGHCSKRSYVSSDCCGSSCLWSLLPSLLDVFLVFLCGYKRVHLFFKHRLFCLFAYNLNKTILKLFAVLHR